MYDSPWLCAQASGHRATAEASHGLLFATHKAASQGRHPYAALFKALADETRLDILGFLAAAGDAICVCQIEDHVRLLSQPTISHHLRQLREAGLVTAERPWHLDLLRRRQVDARAPDRICHSVHRVRQQGDHDVQTDARQRR